MSTKQHFGFLDGLRGIAAAAVVLLHLGARSELKVFEHGYLAVDFFFVLSGFVVAYAYEQRLLTTMSPLTFTAIRLLRLLPLLAAGTAIGAFFEIWRPGITDHAAHYRDIVVALALGSLAIPIPVSLSLEQVIFPINGPGWSLFFELCVNIAFAVALPLFRRTAAILLVASASAALLIYLAFTGGTLDQGARLDDWLAGFPRVGFSFFAGVAVYRLRDRFRAIPAPLIVAALVLILSTPRLPAPWSAMFDLLAVIAVFPLMVGVSSAVTLSGRWLKAAALSGLISYPLYALHYPLVRVAAKALLHVPTSFRLPAAALVTIALVGVAWAAAVYFDAPIRRFLSRRLGLAS